jgi:hypothetical protein
LTLKLLAGYAPTKLLPAVLDNQQTPEVINVPLANVVGELEDPFAFGFPTS